jgi:hypothetical protein
MKEPMVHPAAVVYYAAPVTVLRIHLAEGRGIVLLVVGETGSYQSREAWAKELLRIPRSVVFEHIPIVEEAVPIELVMVVCHLSPAPWGRGPQGVRRNFDAVVDCFGWGNYFVLNILLGLNPDCNSRQLGYIDRSFGQGLAEENLKICQQRNNERYYTAHNVSVEHLVVGESRKTCFSKNNCSETNGVSISQGVGAKVMRCEMRRGMIY